MHTPPALGSSSEPSLALVPSLRIPSRPKRGRLLRRTVALLAGITLMAVPGVFEDSASATAGRPDGPLVPENGFYVGAYSKHPDGYGATRQQAAIQDLETRLGRRLHIDHHFYPWESEFPSWREPWDVENGRIPMISWNGTSTATINSGAYDGMILSRAQAIHDLGEPVFIRWFWEMDGRKKADWSISPESYVAAWRRIHDLFRARQTTNAVWVWCPNASAFNDGEAMAYYPGSEYVDWVCADGYNFAPNRPGDRWRSFDEIFEGFYAAGRKLNKPMMVGEFGVLENNPGDKGRWFHETHDHLAQKFPAIAALVYFNADSTTNGVYFDWRVDTSPEAFEGFHYLFTSNAPVPKHMAPPPPTPAEPPPTTAPPAPVAPASRPVAPRPRPVVPATTKPAPKTNVPPAPEPPKIPSVQLTWVLEILRQLDVANNPGGS